MCLNREQKGCVFITISCYKFRKEQVVFSSISFQKISTFNKIKTILILESFLFYCPCPTYFGTFVYSAKLTTKKEMLYSSAYT
ncbi:unnamed protein product [Bacillus thuringiensis DB27]|uniref:Uncharacterized protein n=1 Tax=Bacillus thuringiensis DB27 TaxID=1431339 RepID=W8ZBE4_BACTU|nr:unnamed protein product [Bacillus thuringiensis DB27]